MRDIAHDAATAAVRAVLQAHDLPRVSLKHKTAQPELVPLPPAAPVQPEPVPPPPAGPVQPEPVPLPSAAPVQPEPVPPPPAGPAQPELVPPPPATPAPPPPTPAQPEPVLAAAISAPAAFPLAASTCRSHLSARRYPAHRHPASAIATDKAPLPREGHETYCPVTSYCVRGCNAPGLLAPACASPARFPTHLCQPGLGITHLRPAMLQLDFRFQYPYPMTTLQPVLRKGGTFVYWTGCG
eukprot:jgi/Tetstr1/444503/TSEL_032382.t1